jgi:putative phage-type endonuclease
MTEHLEQGSDEWLKARCGLVTASRVPDVIAKTKNGWGASRANYMAELIAERLTGEPAPSYTNAAMQWGTQTEPQARAAYEFMFDANVQEVGLVKHPEIAESAASPDGYVGDEGLIEIKCPNTSTHIDTLLGQTIADKYVTQMQWQMACTGRQWCDFVSFDPRMPEDLTLFVQRVERDDKRIDELETLVRQFLGELSEKVQQLEALRAKEAA